MVGINTDTENISELLKTYWSIQRISAGYADQNAASLGLTIQQLAMINVIYSTPGISVADLTKRLIITGSSAAANVDGLISLGLVVKLNKTIPNDSMDLTLKLSKRRRLIKTLYCKRFYVQSHDESIRKPDRKRNRRINSSK